MVAAKRRRIKGWGGGPWQLHSVKKGAWMFLSREKSEREGVMEFPLFSSL